MRYVSTRGGAPEVGFLDVLLDGLAPDGGLYAPVSWPVVTNDQIAGFTGRPYADVAADILTLFAGEDFEEAQVRAVCRRAYDRFSHPAVTPLRQMTSGAFLLELFHGPTLAFKDVAMQVLGGLFELALKARGRTITIVAATSGDTGGAAAAAFAGIEGVRLAILFPEGRISDVQRRFMTATGADNVRCVAIDGDFDACQELLKALFADAAFARETGLAAVNSINFARIAAQTVYYFVSAAALGAPFRPVSFATPTGNFGDAYAGWAARRMALPIEQIIVATNANDIVARALTSGVYRRGKAIATQSPAMDIQVASNFERLHFEYAGRGNRETEAAFAAFARTGELALTEAARAAMCDVFAGVSISEAAMAQAIRRTYESIGQLIDPHTAVAVAGAFASGQAHASAPLVILSTAHPAKFPDAVRAATGQTPLSPPVAARLSGRPERFDRLPADVEAVKALVRAW